VAASVADGDALAFVPREGRGPAAPGGTPARAASGPGCGVGGRKTLVYALNSGQRLGGLNVTEVLLRVESSPRANHLHVILRLRLSRHKLLLREVLGRRRRHSGGPLRLHLGVPRATGVPGALPGGARRTPLRGRVLHSLVELRRVGRHGGRALLDHTSDNRHFLIRVLVCG